MAAISAVHAEAPTWQDTDWREVVALYDLLVQIWPSPVVALNRAVAVGLADGSDAGLAALDALAAEPQLAGYGYLAAARADFLRRLGRTAEAHRRGASVLRGGAPAHRERHRARLPRYAPPATRVIVSLSFRELARLLKNSIQAR